MSKVSVEFINTCAGCVGHEEAIKQAASKHGDAVEVKIYQAGRDTEYLRKYGMVSKGTMIINGKKKIDSLSYDIIEKVIDDEVNK